RLFAQKVTQRKVGGYRGALVLTRDFHKSLRRLVLCQALVRFLRVLTDPVAVDSPVLDLAGRNPGK
ncbi:MAG: hypothetical protein ABEJ65_08100, partial [bacterium]